MSVFQPYTIGLKRNREIVKNQLTIADVVAIAVLEAIGQERKEHIYFALGRKETFDGVSRTHRFEVKFDTKGVYTHNLAIETFCNGKKSGINSTTADIWLHCVPTFNDLSKIDIYVFDIPALKQAIEPIPSIRGGDRNACWLKLLPISQAKLVAKQIKMIKVNFNKLTEPYWMETSVEDSSNNVLPLVGRDKQSETPAMFP